MTNLTRKIAGAAFLSWVGLIVINSSAAADEKGWEFAGEAYLWGAGINATTVTGDEIDISFSDLVRNLDMGLMAALAARKDRWIVIGDLIYLDVSNDTDATGKIIDQPTPLDVKLELKGLIGNLAGGYRFFENDTTGLTVLGGVRYLNLDTDLTFDIGRGLIEETVSESGHVWDGFIGMRGTTDLSDRWYLTYYGDVGTGESDLTWQALAGVNYRFEKVDAVLGYRYLDWRFRDNEVFDDLNISGPFAGVKFRF